MRGIKNSTLGQIRNSEVSLGAGLLWASPELAELFGAMGFDWLWVDLEHGAFDLNRLTDVVRAADAYGTPVIGRLPKVSDAGHILRYAETGLAGFITPHVQSREDVEFVLSAIRYPPLGIRSQGLMRRSGWGQLDADEYYTAANKEIIVLALVEDMCGVQNLESILAVEDLTGVVIGFGDLSMELGHPTDKEHPELIAIRDKTWRQVVDSGKVLQVTAQTPSAAAYAVRMGATMVRLTAHTVLANAAREWVGAARAEVGGRER